MNHYRIIIMPTARRGLIEIGEYIALDNPARAISFLDEITASLKQTLCIFPYSGKIAQDFDLNEEIRVWAYGNYNSYYRVIEDKRTVEILFIFHGNRNIQGLISSL